MTEQLLELKQVGAGIEGKRILTNVSMSVGKGETHVLMGPNGAGKSTLGNMIMGNPAYTLTEGQIFFEGEDISTMAPDKRARLGIFMTFQNPPEVEGLTLESLIRNALRMKTGAPVKMLPFRKKLEKTMRLLDIDPSYADRDLNVGFSGGEKKKAEILQMLMLEPKLAILDETDSGLDVDAVRTVSRGIEEFHRKKDGALMIITHNAAILKELNVDRTHILVKGKIAEDGGPELVGRISEHGFEEYAEEADERTCERGPQAEFRSGNRYDKS